MRLLAIALLSVVLMGCASDPPPPQQAAAPEVQRPRHKPKAKHAALPQPPFDLNTYDGVVADLLSRLDAKAKSVLREIERDELIRFHHSWGRGIRNEYNLWSNEALVKSCGKHRGRDGWIHPDDASMIIMEGVWDVLNSQE